MSTYKCENKECGNVFRSNNPLSCPKCDTLEFSTIHIKSNERYLVFGLLILLIGTGLFFLLNEESSNKESTTTLTLTESKIETIKFNGVLMYSTTSLNVRIKPNKNSKKVTSLKLNTPVLTNTKDIGGWILISDIDSNKLGYVHSNYLSENIIHISTAQKKIVIKPKNEEILSAEDYINRGISKYNLGNYNAAIADYTSAIRIDPDDAIAYYNRGLAKYYLGNYNAAIADYTSAIRIDPDDALAYYNRGIAKDDLGNYNAAITDYTSAIRIDPDFVNAYINRGIAKENLGLRYCSDYKKACDLGTERACEWYHEQCR